MDEHTLLKTALAIALVGIATLALLPDKTPDDITAYIAWTNTTHAWAYTKQPVWIAFETPYEGPKGRCILLSGHETSSGVTNAQPLRDAQQRLRHCQ